MSMIDKVIKQCFKDTANAFMMIIFGGFFSSLLISFGFTVLIAPVAFIIMIVGVWKVISYLFYKSLYTEEAIIYQVLPVKVEEIIVSRIFVGMIAWMLFYLTFIESIALGIAFLSSDIGVMDALHELCELVYALGAAAFVCFAITFITSIFLEVVLIFVGVTYFNTSESAKRNGLVRVAIILGFWALLKGSEMLYSLVLDFATQGEMMTYYLATAGLIVVSIMVGCLGCKLIKNRLENNLQL